MNELVADLLRETDVMDFGLNALQVTRLQYTRYTTTSSAVAVIADSTAYVVRYSYRPWPEIAVASVTIFFIAVSH